MKVSFAAITLVLVQILEDVSAWSSASVSTLRPPSSLSKLDRRSIFKVSEPVPKMTSTELNMMLPMEEVSMVVSDASTTASPFLSALAAYGHYLSIMLITACLVVERVTIKANMSEEEETRMAIADTTLGASGLLLAVSGYYRVVQYGKGWEFYSHEPVFWLKLVFVAIFGACSFFPTTKIIQRSIAQRNGNFTPMSEKLAARMTTLINAELLALFTIPVTATLMARGIGYTDMIPWQVEAALVPLVLVGLGGKVILIYLPVTSILMFIYNSDRLIFRREVYQGGSRL